MHVCSEREKERCVYVVSKRSMTEEVCVCSEQEKEMCLYVMSKRSMRGGACM